MDPLSFGMAAGTLWQTVAAGVGAGRDASTPGQINQVRTVELVGAAGIIVLGLVATLILHRPWPLVLGTALAAGIVALHEWQITK